MERILAKSMVMMDVTLGRRVEREVHAFTCYTLYSSLEMKMLCLSYEDSLPLALRVQSKSPLACRAQLLFWHFRASSTAHKGGRFFGTIRAETESSKLLES
jgi:hypothetical protein